MNSKKIILILAATCGIYMSSKAQNMFVRQHNNVQNAYAINDLKSIKFSLGQVYVHKNNGVDSYPLDTIRYINFRDLKLGINESPKINTLSFSLYPNPADNQLNISFSENIAENGTVTLYTIEGKIIMKHLIQNGSQSFQFNIDNLNAGMYMCNIQIGKQINTQKFIKN